MHNKKGKVIAITSTKGGVGKTVLTLLLGYIYRRENLKVLIMDMDLYSGSVALSLGMDVSKTVYNYADDLSNNRFEDIHDYVVAYDEKLDVLPACKDPRQAGKIDSKYLSMMIHHAKYSYDVILVDTTHILGEHTVTIMDESDIILSVMLNDPYNVKNEKSFVSILRDVEKSNMKLVLNESIFLGRSYFSSFDLKNVIKHGVDYTVSKDLNIRNIDKYLMDGTLFSYYDRLGTFDRGSYNKVVTMAKSLLNTEEE